LHWAPRWTAGTQAHVPPRERFKTPDSRFKTGIATINCQQSTYSQHANRPFTPPANGKPSSMFSAVCILKSKLRLPALCPLLPLSTVYSLQTIVYSLLSLVSRESVANRLELQLQLGASITFRFLRIWSTFILISPGQVVCSLLC